MAFDFQDIDHPALSDGKLEELPQVPVGSSNPGQGRQRGRRRHAPDDVASIDVRDALAEKGHGVRGSLELRSRRGVHTPGHRTGGPGDKIAIDDLHHRIGGVPDPGLVSWDGRAVRVDRGLGLDRSRQETVPISKP